MPRLVSVEKGGFYRFPEAHLPAVASLVTPNVRGGKILDPCAGEGHALDYLARVWQLTPYANEIDNTRAAACKALFGATQTVHGDMYQLKASSASFSALWVNPPYAWETVGEDKRREFAMLKHALKWAQPDALVFWIVYSHHLTLETVAYLAQRSTRLEVWRLPGLHLGEYTQVVAVAQLGRPTGDTATLAQQLPQAAHVGTLPELTLQATPCYALPAPLTGKSFVFCPKVVSPEAALQGVLEAGAHFSAGVQTLLQPEPPPERLRPIVRPRGGQLALILAAGLFNGLVLETEQGRMAVRSTIETVERQVAAATVEEADETTVEKEVYRTQSNTTITLLGEDGTLQDLSGDGPLASFISTHKTALLAYLEQHFTPLYTFDYSPLKVVLARSLGGKLYPTQKHVVAACWTAFQHRKSVILCGEMGVGKTLIGATIAAALQPQMQAGQVVIVMAPPHLVEKWEREVRRAAPLACVCILHTAEEVSAFMAQAQTCGNRLPVGILSREVAKLGEGWAVAVNWRKRHVLRWRHDEPHPADEQGQPFTGERVITYCDPLCPSCGAVVEKERDTPADLRWLERVPRFCAQCHSALWTNTRTFSKGKTVNGHLKNPRTPLAAFIAERYRQQLFLLISDELHEAKSTSTDQGQSMMVLANAATKVLGLTGTLHGGAASSLYGIEFTFNPRVRRRFPWGGGIHTWVKAMGCLERIVQYRPEYDKAGVYSGKRRIEQKPREAPGCSPLLVAEIIDHTLFVGLSDMGQQLPRFEEIPVAIEPTPAIAEQYDRAKQVLGEYLFQRRLEGDASALGMYLQTLLSWPSAPYRTEACIHRRRVSKDSDVFVECPVHTLPGLSEDTLYPKEQWLIDTVREELAQGRGVAVFVRQTGQRNIQPRLEQLLREHIPAARPFILKPTVKADQRESVLNKQIATGCNLLICNPRLVQTGLDLIDFPTLIFFEVDYSLYVMSQASRRAWRLIQTRDCKVYYPHYSGLMEHQAVELIGRKQAAAALLYGENTSAGLSALNGSDGGNLLAALATEIDRDAAVTDLRDLFARAAKEVDPAESAWFAQAETTETPLSAEDDKPTILALPTSTLPPSDLLFVLAQEFPQATPLQPISVSAGAVLPPRKKVKRRRVHLFDAPSDEPISTLDLLAGHDRRVERAEPPVQPLPAASPTPTIQLSLF